MQTDVSTVEQASRLLAVSSGHPEQHAEIAMLTDVSASEAETSRPEEALEQDKSRDTKDESIHWALRMANDRVEELQLRVLSFEEQLLEERRQTESSALAISYLLAQVALLERANLVSSSSAAVAVEEETEDKEEEGDSREARDDTEEHAEACIAQSKEQVKSRVVFLEEKLAAMSTKAQEEHLRIESSVRVFADEKEELRTEIVSLISSAKLGEAEKQRATNSLCDVLEDKEELLLQVQSLLRNLRSVGQAFVEERIAVDHEMAHICLAARAEKTAIETQVVSLKEQLANIAEAQVHELARIENVLHALQAENENLRAEISSLNTQKMELTRKTECLTMEIANQQQDRPHTQLDFMKSRKPSADHPLRVENGSSNIRGAQNQASIPSFEHRSLDESTLFSDDAAQADGSTLASSQERDHVLGEVGVLIEQTMGAPSVREEDDAAAEDAFATAVKEQEDLGSRVVFLERQLVRMYYILLAM